MPEEPFEGCLIERAVEPVKRRCTDREAVISRDQQPGRDVRVVVEFGDDDLVPRRQRTGDRVCEQEIDRGCVGSEDDLLDRATEEVRRRLAGVVEQFVSGFRSDEASAEVCVRGRQVVGDDTGDVVRCLRAPRAVQIDNRGPGSLARQC